MNNCDATNLAAESIANESIVTDTDIGKEYDAIWTEVDPHLPLMWHVIQSRIPGSLFPRRKTIVETQNKDKQIYNKKRENDSKSNDASYSENSNAKTSKSAARRLRRKQQKSKC